VIDTVAKSFEIKIDHDAVALGNVSLRLGHRLVGRSTFGSASGARTGFVGRSVVVAIAHGSSPGNSALKAGVFFATV
jgi:hypothetical protein